MKKIALIYTLLLMFVMTVSAQQDTSKINELEKGQEEFEEKIKTLDTKIDSLKQAMTNNELSEEQRLEFEKNIQESKKKIDAYKYGIKDIENDLNELKKEKTDNSSEQKNEDHKELPQNNNKKSDKFKSNLPGIDIGLNNVMNSKQGIGFPEPYSNMDLNSSKSWNIAFNFKALEIPVFPELAAFVVGMGMEWNNYRFLYNITLVKDEDGNIIAQEEEGIMSFRKNTLNTFFFNIPLLFEIHIPTEKKYVNLAAGIVGGVKLGSKTKQVYNTIDGNKKRNKNKGDYQLSTFRYGLTTRLGYKSIQLYVNYSMISLFKKEKGPEVYPFSLGMTLGF